MYVGMRNFHSKNGYSHPLARNRCLEGDGHLAGKSPETFVGLFVKMEDVVVLYVLRDDQGVPLGQWIDVEDIVKIVAISVRVIYPES